MTFGERSSYQAKRRRLKLPMAASVLTSLWLWFGYVSPLQQESAQLLGKIEKAGSDLLTIREEELLLRELERRLPALEHELLTLRQMLWVSPGGESLLPLIDPIARSAGARIETFSAAPADAGSGSLTYWKCDLKASFRSMLALLREMSRCERIIHLRSLTMAPVWAGNRSPGLLRLSLHLAAPAMGDDIR